MTLTNTVVEETTKRDLTKSLKPKSHKCNRCGRWISSPVKVAGNVYGSGCAKKARLEKAISESRQLDLTQEIEKKSEKPTSNNKTDLAALIVPEAIIKSLPVLPTTTITTPNATTTEIKQVGEIWLNNKVSGQCFDCDTNKPILSLIHI